MKVALVAASLFASTVVATSQTPSLQINKENRTISVSATDTAYSDPEIASIHIGFQAYGGSLQEAYKNASDVSATITKALSSVGVLKSAIESSTQSVSQISSYEVKNTPAARGAKYRVQQSWTVRVPADDAAKTLDAAIQAGANQSGSIDWQMKNSTTLESQAVAKATDRAKALAAELAKGIDSRLGKVVYATNDVSGDVIRPMAYARNAVEMRAAPGADTTAPLVIEPSRVERTATVHLIFAIE